MKLEEITDTIESIAPVLSQESYDNSGLLIGNKDELIKGALITLDVTEEVIDEAISLGFNLIISHHPLIFKPVKKINGTNLTERCIIKAIRHGIAIYAVHTNLDNSFHGVNAILAEKLGLNKIEILQPVKGSLIKYVVFVPESHAEQVRDAIFRAGAGVIGNYDCCSFNVEGKGTFRANAGSSPFIGNIGTLHTEPEIRIETIMPKWIENKVLKSVREVHPYEEIAWDSYPLTNISPRIGAGMIGMLPEALEEVDFLQNLKQILNVPFLKHSPFVKRKIMKVGVCGGSGNFLIEDAIGRNCDVFITGELKYHDYFLADKKIVLIEAGHYETEQFSKELLYRKLKEKFTTFALQISGTNSNPVNYL
ncbi:MAG TPA: Nif3-like dinuclear metal center hexameric protein [Lentimicrobium sp.]|nr:Nif3-like dinuclear metal center hexameric protein [Lentimicrobium sp.]